MKTFYVLLGIIFILAAAAILISSMPLALKLVLVCLALGLTYWESRQFVIKNMVVQGDKILVTDQYETYETDFLPSSVVGRYLCFLHLVDTTTDKRWYIPISRLEFSREGFQQLKCLLQRFSMQAK